MKPIFRGIVIAAGLAALAFVAGCTVRPLLATDTLQPQAGGKSVAGALSSVEIAPVSTRYAQQVRNDLIFLLYGGGAGSPDPHYTLALHVKETKTSAATIQIADEQQPTAQVLKLQGDYILTENETGRVVAKGRREISSPYDVSRQQYSVYRTEIDAENRAARELAEAVRLSIGQALARLPSQG